MPRGAKPKIVEGVYSKQHSLYLTWKSLRARCRREQNPDYKYYGGRGIKVCDRWESSFKNFVEDMGPRPEGYQLDREDNDGDYTPENCRWVDKNRQMENRGLRSDNSLGIKNIQFRKDCGLYRVDIKRGGVQLNKCFSTLEDALEARDKFLMENS